MIKEVKNYTKEEYEIAKSVNILDYLRQSGYELKKLGNQYCLREHDSLIINQEKNCWNWFSRGKGGSLIDFLIEYENKSVVEAVKNLSSSVNYERREYTRYESVKTDEKEI